MVAGTKEFYDAKMSTWANKEVSEMEEIGQEEYRVCVYLTSNATHEFIARDNRNAREIAKRIITEGLWIVNDDATEEFYPTSQVYKVKIVPDCSA